MLLEDIFPHPHELVHGFFGLARLESREAKGSGNRLCVESEHLVWYLAWDDNAGSCLKRQFCAAEPQNWKVSR